MKTTIFLTHFLLVAAFTAQAQFIKYEGNPVLRLGPAGSWESKQVSHPRILFDGKLFRMWYAGSNDTCRQIGYATSVDGINWTKHPNNPIIKVGLRGAIDDMVVSPGAVVYDGTNYLMYYTARSYASYGAICHATSPDGISWTKDTANNPILKKGAPGWWDDFGLSAGPVLKQDTTWKMWYNGFRYDTRWHAGIATSTDGVHWIKDTLSNPLFEKGVSGTWDEYEQWIADVLPDSSYYEAFYFGNAKQRAIGYAVSRDGIAWGKYEGNPILTPESSTDDKAVLFQSCVLKNGEEYKIWYSDGMTAQICFALSAAFTPASAQEQEKRMLATNKPVPAATKSESKQVPKEINPFTVEFDGQNVNFKNFVTWDRKKVMEFSAPISKELEKITGSSSISPNEVTVKPVGDAAFVFLKNGVIGIYPNGEGTSSNFSSLLIDVQKGTTYENQENSAVIIITNTNLAIMTPLIKLNIVLAGLFGGNSPNNADVIQDPDNPNCALLRENGKPKFRIHTEAKDQNMLIENYGPTALLGSRE
jgi:predicted GH43/DUF377 family glycosyl hydrolase